MCARHDYQCFHDGSVLTDIDRPISVGAQADPPLCPECGNRMTWIPAIGMVDLLSDGTDGPKFEMYDGQNQKVVVDSFAKMRKLEHESAVQAANQEGAPLRFRALHQSKSNMDRNTFGDGPAEKPSAEAARRFGLQGATRQHGGTEPTVTFGPGVSESNTSALKD